MTSHTVKYLPLPDRQLAYSREETNDAPTQIMFLGGFGAAMNGSKASFLAEQCAGHNYGYVRFDYRGHGLSSGTFTDGTIGMWLEDSLAVLDNLTTAPQIIVGSSMGGWLALLLALARPERVRGIVGIAAAPDFTQELIWPRLSTADRERLMRDGILEEEGLPVTWRLIEEGREHLIMGGEQIPITAPIRLLHGQRDASVPWSYALRIADKMVSENVSVTLIKNGDHRLSRPCDLEMLWKNINSIA